MFKIIIITFFIPFTVFGFDLKKIEDEHLKDSVVTPEKAVKGSEKVSTIVIKEECKKNDTEDVEVCEKALGHQ